MSTGTVSVHSWNDSTFIPAALSSKSNPLSARQKMVGAIDGSWIDTEDDGEPEMGLPFNARLIPAVGTRSGRDRQRSRTGGRGLRSNPVRRRAGEGEEGW